MDEPRVCGRDRAAHGEISRRHGDTFIRTLRKAYGLGFAEGFPDEDLLKDVLATMDGGSLRRLVHDHQQGRLDAKLKSANASE